MPPVGKYLSKAEITQLLESILADYWDPADHFLGISDDKLYLPTHAEIDTIIADPRTHVTGFAGARQRFDCDDFSFVFKGNMSLYARDINGLTHSLCVGIAWGGFTWIAGRHACNWVLTQDERLRWIEPQTRLQYVRSKCRKGTLELIIA